MERSRVPAGQRPQPPEGTPIDPTQFAKDMTTQFRQRLSTRRMNQLSSLAQARTSSPARPLVGAPQSPSVTDAPPSYSSLRNIPLVPQAPHPSDLRSLRFRNQLHMLSETPTNWENPGLLDDALRAVPTERIYAAAEEQSQVYKAQAESLGKAPKWTYADCVIRALMTWFHDSFFEWVNNPPCSRCYAPTVGLGRTPPLPEEQARSAGMVELYQCSNAQCQGLERFPRYKDAFVLLEERKGRCGEWVNCFGMLCRAIGARVRWIWNPEDYVWLEVWSEYQQRWVHCDVTENTWDQPLMYTEGWKKKMSYIIAFSSEGAYDVTRRYVRDQKYANPRNKCPESVLLHILAEIRAKRRARMTKEEKFRLQGEDMREERALCACTIQAIISGINNLSIDSLLSGAHTTPRSDIDAQKAAERAAENAQSQRVHRSGESRHGSPRNQQNPQDPPR
ncbi:protein png1 [Westerdykella ornata]|uniref:Protein png1 n=1 Tax=Westerdykella ornata TaxID=318751 RepID=A0A6A6JIG5_WESOR|nr:protein png1 [Westerdykella ornata]KAF2275883.1 protein png1 [Westerdykella ornata]